MLETKTTRHKKQIIIGIIFLVFLVSGWVYPLIGFFIPACMVLGLGIGAFKGRKWCDWYCPRGSFYDSLLKKLSPNREIPQYFKKIPVRVIIFSFLLIIMTLQIIRHWPDPYEIGKFFMALLTTTTIIGIILGFIFHQRTWCYICPVGTLSNLIGRDKSSLKLNSDKCVNCELCAKACPIQLKPYDKEKTPDNYDCLKCNSCIDACPKKALNF